jgi:hypothetical protein
MPRTLPDTFSTLIKLRFFKSIALLLISFTSLGQIDQQARFEILLNENDINENYATASLDKQGILVYRRLVGRGDDQLELIKVDTTLKENWHGYIAVQKNLRISHIKVKDEVIFILLKSATYTTGDFQVLAIKADDGNYKVYTIKNLIPFNPTDFIVTSYGMMLGGYFNYRPLVLHFSFQTERSKILPGLFNEQGELTQIKPYDNGFIDVIISAKNFERKKCLWIRNYDAEADLVKTTVLEPEANKNLIFGRSVKMPNDEQVVAGVYGNKNVEYARGVFVADINPFGEYNINYYNFSDLQNFFSYMKVRREKRVKERIERRKIKGKKTRFNYRLLIQEVVPYRDQFIMLGEAFYPKYYYLNSSGYGNRGDRIFDGYQYTHAIVIGFDAQGKLKWDNSFEINDVKTFELQQYVKIAPSENQISLVYFHDNLLRSKIIKDNQVLEGKTTDPIKSKFETDLIKKNDTQTSKLDYWYSRHFFASGIQKVRNQQAEGLYRKVFFINKIKY